MAEGPKTQMPARRKARKRALDVLYQADLRDLPPARSLESYLQRIAKPHPDHLDYTVGLVEGVAEHLDRIDELIASYAEGWTLDRMPVVDRNLARIAVFELLYVPRDRRPGGDHRGGRAGQADVHGRLPALPQRLLGRIAEFATR